METRPEESPPNRQIEAPPAVVWAAGILGSTIGGIVGGHGIYSIVTVGYAEHPSHFPEWVAQFAGTLLGALFGAVGGGVGAAVIALYLSLAASRRAGPDFVPGGDDE